MLNIFLIIIFGVLGVLSFIANRHIKNGDFLAFVGIVFSVICIWNFIDFVKNMVMIFT